MQRQWCLVALLPLRENGVVGGGGAEYKHERSYESSEALELWYPLGGNVKCEPLWKTVRQFGKQLIICNPANLVLYPREMERHSPQTLVH